MWVLSDAGHGFVFITSNQTNQLGDNGHSLSLEPNKTNAEKWRITSAGGGKVFLQRQRGFFLTAYGGNVGLTHHADKWEKWSVLTAEGERACQFSDLELFCFTVTRARAGGSEAKLLRRQCELGAGIFGCDESLVLSDAEESLGPSCSTTLIAPLNETTEFDGELFLEAWERVQVKEDGRFKAADWIIKVDPDAVFFPERLRTRLGGKMHSRTHSTFFANCNPQAAGSERGRQPGEHAHFMHGPLQVFSFKAVDTFFIHADFCRRKIELDSSMPEGRYMTHCLKLVGTNINPHMSLHLLSDPHCDNPWTAPECTSEAVAFHNFSSTEAYTECWTTAHSSDTGAANEVEVKK